MYACATMLALMIDVSPEVKMPALPCAEQIDPVRYKEYRQWVRDNIADCPTKTIALASNKLEHGIRTKDSNLMDAAYGDLDQLAEQPEYDIADYDHLQAGIFQAYRNHFWLRLDRQSSTAEDNWEAYQAIGSLLRLMLHLPDYTLEDHGGLSELLTHGSLLRSQAISPQYRHFPASVREARHGGPRTNHNVVGLHTDGGRVLHKSSAVKVYTHSKHFDRAPGIDILKPLSRLVALGNEGYYLEEEAVYNITNLPTPGQRYLGFGRFVGQLMVKESADEGSLKPFELSLLNDVTTHTTAVLNRHSLCASKPQLH